MPVFEARVATPWPQQLFARGNPDQQIDRHLKRKFKHGKNYRLSEKIAEFGRIMLESTVRILAVILTESLHCSGIYR